MNRRLVLLGSDIARDVFPAGVDPVGKEITVAGLKLQVAGVLKSKGASAMSSDKVTVYACYNSPSIFFTSKYEFQHYGHADQSCQS